MTSTSHFSSVAILGPGLLGGSVALAIRHFLPNTEVRLWGRRREPLDLALARGAASYCTTDIGQAVDNADLVIMASPVGAMKSLAEQCIGSLKKGALITDVGSVKKSVHRDLGSYLTRHDISFIGSHPMAGSEKQGIEHASSLLFVGSRVAITNEEGVTQAIVERLTSFWSSLGAQCMHLSADEHDKLVAEVSHLPHSLAALCAIATAETSDLTKSALLASTGFRDTTRVADGPPAMWAEILLENGAAVDTALSQAKEQLESLHSMIRNQDRDALQKWLEKAKTMRRNIVGN